jgi:hypothetical protein
MVNYLDLRPSHSVENPFSDWQQLGAAVLLFHAVAFSTENAQSQSMASPIRAEAKTQSTNAAVANQAQNPPLFSFNYAIDSAKSLAFGGSAQPLPDGANIALIGGLGDEAIPWFATLDGQGKIRWAARLGVEHRKLRAEITNRGTQVFGFSQTGENQALVASFPAESMTAGKAARLDLTPLLNDALIELPGISPLPPVVTVVQDGGDAFALTVISQDAEITLNKIYSIPAFATRSKSSPGNPSRGRVFPVPDGSGYYLAISDIQRSTKNGSAGEKRLGLVRVDRTGALLWAKIYHFKGATGLPLVAKVAIDGSILATPVIGSNPPNVVVRIAPDGRRVWAKAINTPGFTFSDFHCDGTPYRFIKPYLLAVGLVASNGLPLTVLLALDYDTGQIVNQTRFPNDFSGGSGICPVTGDSVYVSTLGVQMSKSSYRNTASIARFDQQLRFITAKEIIGAEGCFPLLCRRDPGMNLLSYPFSKPPRGVAAALDDNLQPIDTPCPWIKDLRLTMAQCSYTTTDAESSEENLDVTLAPGNSRIQPAELKLVPLDLHVTLEAAKKSADR